MNSLKLFFQLGFEHIWQLGAWDHILFLLLVSIIYPIHKWKKIIGLISLFTFGHCFSIIFIYSFNIPIKAVIIESLIILTILYSAFYLIYQNQSKYNSKFLSSSSIPYTIFVFGLVHGTAIGQSFISLLNSNTSFILKLISFNLGVEIGQLIFFIIFIFLLFLLTIKLQINSKKIILFLAYFSILFCIFVFVNRFFNFFNNNL